MQCPNCKYTWIIQCPCCEHSYCPNCHITQEEAEDLEMELEEAEENDE